MALTGLNMFRADEVVQVLDDTTSIWESAKVVAVSSDWTIKIKWTNWPNPRDGVTVKVPESVRQLPSTCWNVRKFQKKDETPCESRKRRRGAHPDGNPPFTGNPGILTRSDEVRFYILRLYSAYRWKIE